MVHGIQFTLDVHLDCVVLQVDVANDFNNILCKVIFQRLQTIRGQLFHLFPFVNSFYAFQFPLFFSHHSLLEDLFIIFSFMGMCYSDPPCWAFFCICIFLCYFQAFSPCVFSLPWLIMTPMSLALPMWFPLLMIIVFQLVFMKLVAQLHNCLVQAPFNLPLRFTFLADFCSSIYDIKILGVLFGSGSFFSSFLQEVLDEDVRHGHVFLKLGDVQVAFGILFQCFIQRFSYLFHYFSFFWVFSSNLPFLIWFCWEILRGFRAQIFLNALKLV